MLYFTRQTQSMKYTVTEYVYGVAISLHTSLKFLKPYTFYTTLANYEMRTP